MAIGISMDNVALGPAFGAAFGGGLGAAFEGAYKKKREEAGEGPDSESQMNKQTGVIIAGILVVGILALLLVYLALRG